MARVVFSRDPGKWNLFQKPVERKDVSNYCCISNVKFVATAMFGSGDDVPALDDVWSPTCMLISGFVDYNFGVRWIQWTAVEIIVTVEAGVG